MLTLQIKKTASGTTNSLNEPPCHWHHHCCCRLHLHRVQDQR